MAYGRPEVSFRLPAARNNRGGWPKVVCPQADEIDPGPPKPSFLTVNSLLTYYCTCLSDSLLGISSEGCVINYTDVNSPPYYVSLGDPTLSEEDGVVYFDMSGRGHISEILKRHVIDFEDLLRVAKSFYLTGTRPEVLIKWE
jgi:hypothetical protein